MSEKTVNLTLDNLKELFTHWADEMRKPVPPTPQEQVELAQAQQYRLENANSVKEKMERKRREHAVCTHRHNRKDGGASHVVHVYDNDYPGHPGYIYCQKFEVRIRPDDELWRKLDPSAVFNNGLFIELMQECPLTGPKSSAKERSDSMGNYRYSLPEVTDSLNRGIKDKLDGKRGNAKELIQKLEEEVTAGRATAEDIHAGQEIFLKTDELRAKQAQSVQDERDFLAKHPEFKPTKANWERMCLYLEGANVEANSGLATFEDMEAALQHLKPLGALELNKASLCSECAPKQEQRLDSETE